MTTTEIKLTERIIKSYLTIGEPAEEGFIYTKELVEDVLKLQQSLIDQRKLFVTLGYDGESLTDEDIGKVEGIVTKAEITEDNKITYTVQFLQKQANLYLNMSIPMSVRIPIKAKLIKNKYITDIEIENYIDMVFDNPVETLQKLKIYTDTVKELIATIKVK